MTIKLHNKSKQTQEILDQLNKNEDNQSQYLSIETRKVMNDSIKALQQYVTDTQKDKKELQLVRILLF